MPVGGFGVWFLDGGWRRPPSTGPRTEEGSPRQILRRDRIEPRLRRRRSLRSQPRSFQLARSKTTARKPRDWKSTKPSAQPFSVSSAEESRHGALHEQPSKKLVSSAQFAEGEGVSY